MTVSTRAIPEEIEGLETLKPVLDWSLARRPRAVVVEVVVQDEFHHEVIVGVSDEVLAVFETT